MPVPVTELGPEALAERLRNVAQFAPDSPSGVPYLNDAVRQNLRDVADRLVEISVAQLDRASAPDEGRKDAGSNPVAVARCSADTALGVTEWDRKLAGDILEDFGSFEEGIADQEKLAQWVRNIRRGGVAQASVEQAKAYVDRAIASYVGDPADNQFQKGFLAALEVVRDEAFSLPSTNQDTP